MHREMWGWERRGEQVRGEQVSQVRRMPEEARRRPSP